jgi:hypothetical protein
LSKAAILHLGDCWPQSVAFPALLEAALRLIGAASQPRNSEEEGALADLLFRAVRGGHVAIHLHPPQLTVTVSERPQASRLARAQLLKGSMVTNQQHRPVVLEGPIVRAFGSRTVDELVTDLGRALRNAATAGNGGEAGMEAVSRESVEKNLMLLAQMGLLVA